MAIDADELAEIKALAHDPRRECRFGVDWQRIALNLVSEIERLQGENAKTLGILATMVLPDIEKAEAEGRL